MNRSLLLAAATFFLALAGCTSKGSQTPAQPAGGRKGEGGGAIPVLVARAAHKDVPLEIQVIGNVEAYATITIKAQVPGQITRVSFQEGDYVKKGDLLFTIDPSPYEAALKQAEANLERDLAQLAQAQANLDRDIANAEYARAQAGRYERLFKEGVISREQTEQFRASANAGEQGVRADKAAIASAQAAVAAGKAAVETTRVQLSYTRIRSPLDGRTGSLMVKEGNIVSALQTDLMTINQVQPIYVTFGVPEANLGAIREHMARGRLAVIAKPQDETAPEEQGVLTFVDNAVDATTGTIKLRGTFSNANRRLWPGQFIRVTLRLATLRDAVVVPNQAVQTGQNGEYVMVVNSDQRVEARPVTTSARAGEDMVVEKGLQAGETVVTEGHLRLAPGMRVQVRAPGGGRPGGGGGRKRAE